MHFYAINFRQKGAALIVSLVLLVVALLLSLSGMQSSRLEESMAGNYRASERALMAAEYGASIIVSAARQVQQSPEEKTLGEVLEEIIDEAAGGSMSPQLVDGSAYYRIEVGDVVNTSGGVEIELVSIGEVYSGNPNGVDGSEVVARREIVFTMGVDLGIDSPLSFMCPGSYELPSNADSVVGEEPPEEEVDGVFKYKPAIAAGGRRQARYVVAGIYGLNNDGDNYEDSKYASDSVLPSGKFYFMNSNGMGLVDGDDASDGVYHASGFVEVADNPEDYRVRYDLDKEGCKQKGKGAGSNALCNFKGGISTQYGAPALSSPLAFHEFVNAIFDSGDGNIVYQNISEGQVANTYADGKINIFTRNLYHYASSDMISLDEHAGAPLVFESQAIEVYGGEEEVIGAEAVASGGLVEGGVTLFSGAEVSYDDHVLARNQVLESSSPWTPNSQYFPSNLGYFEVDQGAPQVFYDPDASKYKVALDFAGGGGQVAYPEGQIAPWSKQNQVVRLDSGIERDTFRLGSQGQSFKPDVAVGQDVGAVVVIDGNAEWGPSPIVNGILVILGDFMMTGGGVGVYSGAVFGAPYFFDSEEGGGEFVCQRAFYDAKGGGGFSVVFSRKYIDNAFDMLPSRAKLALLQGQAVTAEPRGWVERMQH